jgi:hypothetical protein
MDMMEDWINNLYEDYFLTQFVKNVCFNFVKWTCMFTMYTAKNQFDSQFKSVNITLSTFTYFTVLSALVDTCKEI